MDRVSTDRSTRPDRPPYPAPTPSGAPAPDRRPQALRAGLGVLLIVVGVGFVVDLGFTWWTQVDPIQRVGTYDGWGSLARGGHGAEGDAALLLAALVVVAATAVVRRRWVRASGAIVTGLFTAAIALDAHRVEGFRWGHGHGGYVTGVALVSIAVAAELALAALTARRHSGPTGGRSHA